MATGRVNKTCYPEAEYIEQDDTCVRARRVKDARQQGEMVRGSLDPREGCKARQIKTSEDETGTDKTRCKTEYVREENEAAIE